MKQKHGLVIFTKYPEAGVTKTRLTEQYGGALTGDEASGLYRAMLLDVATMAMRALELCRREDGAAGEYEFFISSSPADRLTRMHEMFAAEFPGHAVHHIIDRGENFDEHFNDCFKQLFDHGCHSVVCIGGDLPTMQADLVARAFAWLRHLEADSAAGAMVLAPCQSGGVSLVGATCDAFTGFTGAFYNPSGVPALDALINIGAARDVPVALLEAVADVDFMEDLGHMISVVNAMSYAARFQPDIAVPERTMDFINRVGLYTHTPPNECFDCRSEIDDPGHGRSDKVQRL